MLISPGGNASQRKTSGWAERVVWLDLETKRVTGTFVLPSEHAHTLAPMLADGRVLLRSRTNGGTRLVDVKKHMEPTP